jgi:hypothetical protein
MPRTLGDGTRSEQREELPPEPDPERLALVGRQALRRADRIPVLRQPPEALGDARLLPPENFADPRGLEVTAGGHVELVEVRAENREIAQALEQRRTRIFGHRQHAGVELEQATSWIEQVARGLAGSGRRRRRHRGVGRIRRPLGQQPRARGDREGGDRGGVARGRAAEGPGQLGHRHPLEGRAPDRGLATPEATRQPDLEAGLLEGGRRAPEQDHFGDPGPEPLGEPMAHGLFAAACRDGKLAGAAVSEQRHPALSSAMTATARPESRSRITLSWPICRSSVRARASLVCSVGRRSCACSSARASSSSRGRPGESRRTLSS